MESGSVLTAVILLTICIVPIIYMHLRRRKREQKIVNSLTSESSRQNSHISKHEFCGDYVIGIDEVNNFVFFRNDLKNNTRTQFVDLTDIEKCELLISRRQTSQRDSDSGAIERLVLSFTPKKGNDLILFEFYNDSVSFQLYGELQSIERWSKLINDRMNE